MTHTEAMKLAIQLRDTASGYWTETEIPIIEKLIALLAQPEQPKYRRGSRVICLETEEYCVIHISGTDRQWVKFPDSHIGVYTNEQVAELFELLPKEQPQPEQNLNCKSAQARLATAWGYVKAQPQQEPVAWIHNFIEGGISIGKRPADLERHPDRWTALFKDPKPCPTCEALARTVMLDQTSHDAGRTWVGLDWLPEHKCGLYLSHNEHRDVYETIEEYYIAKDFISQEEWHKAVKEDSVWVLQWYPNTPIGFNRIAASTLQAIETKLKEITHE